MLVERRNHMRFEAPLQLQYKISGRAPLEGISAATNLSRGGIKFFLIKKISVGSVLELRFRLPGENNPISAIGKIVWLRGERKSGFEAGIEFVEIDSFDRSRMLAYAYDLWLNKRN